MSPILDVSYSCTQAEEKCLDVLIQDVRFNLSVPFLVHLGRYFIDSLPSKQVEKGIINHGYDNNNQTVSVHLFKCLIPKEIYQMPIIFRIFPIFCII